MPEDVKQNILVTRSSLPNFDEYVEEIRPIFESHWLTNMGPKHQELEKQLSEYLDVPYVSLFANGHLALECAFQAMELQGEVITTPFTFISTTNAIVRSGLTPVFCDIKPDDFTLDPEKIEEKITENTCATAPVHVYGTICEHEAIARIAEKYSLKVIYDAAHAFGVCINDGSVAALGDASMFSFHATKVFHTIEGGAITTSSKELYDKLAAWKNFGITGPETAAYRGGNAKMNEFAAAMGLCNLRHVGDYIEKRGRAVARYSERLGGVPGIRFIEPQDGVTQNYAYFPVIFEDTFGATRDDVMEALAAHGIGSRKYFFPLITDMGCYSDSYDANSTLNAFNVAFRVLSLPLYSDLSQQEVDTICDIILDCSC